MAYAQRHTPATYIENIYAQFPGQPIGFVDEAFRGFERAGEHPFYVATAVVVERDDMEPVRKDLLELAGDSYWHTSEALRTEDGRRRASEMLAYLAEGREPCVVASTVTIDPDDRSLERARSSCLGALACSLSAGIEEVTPSVDVFVIEKRNTEELNKADKNTHSSLISNGELPRHHRLVQASPADDRLLWLPDVVSSAVRRSMAFADNVMYDQISDRITFVPPLKGSR